MDEDAATSVRRKKDASINVCMRLVHDGQRRRGRDRRSHRRRRGLGHRPPRPPAGCRPARPGHPDGHRPGPVHAPRHRRDHGRHGPQPRPVRLHGRAVRGARAGRQPPDRGAAVHRRGGRQGRPAGQGRHDPAPGRPPVVHRQRRGTRPAAACRGRGRVRRVRRQRGHEVLRGPRGRDVRHAPGGVQAAALGAHRLPVHAPGHQPHPAQVRLRAPWRRAAAGRQRHGAHHPRPGQAADDRLRGRRRRAVGAGRHPGPHRGVARRIGRHPAGRPDQGAVGEPHDGRGRRRQTRAAAADGGS